MVDSSQAGKSDSIDEVALASGSIIAPALPDKSGLDKSLAVGIAWTGAVKWAAQIISWASTLILARLLTPSDFGLVGMAIVYLGLITLFSEFGLGTAVVTLRGLDNEQIAQLNTVSLLFGFLSSGITCALAVPLAKFFKAPQLTLVVVIMSAGFIVSAFRTIPYSLLERDLRFKLLAFIDAIGAVAQSLSMVALALLGFRYWALVCGGLLGTAVATALPFLKRPAGFSWPRLNSIKHAIRFSWHVIVGRLSWYGYSNADFVVAGRVLGQASLGAYTFAWNLASIPVEKVTNIVTRVTPAFFSAVQTDDAALRRYLSTLTEALALLTFPATIGLSLVARDFVLLALGPQWVEAAVPLEILAFYASLRSVVTILPQVLTVVGETGFVMWVNIWALLILPAAFYVGSRWGTTGIAMGWVVVYPFIVFSIYRRTLRKIQMPLHLYLKAVWPALNGCLLMTLCVELAKWLLPPKMPLYFYFSVEVLVGGIAYGLSLILAHRDRLRAFLRLARTLRGNNPL